MSADSVRQGSQLRTLVAVLAAGRSARMGFPKLLAPYPDGHGGQTCLLERACTEALASRAAHVAVVGGAYLPQTRALVAACAKMCARSARFPDVASPHPGRPAQQAVQRTGAPLRTAGPRLAQSTQGPLVTSDTDGPLDRLVLLENDAWQQGQSSSVRLAAAHADEHGFDALLVMAADQPFVCARHLDALIAAFEERGAQRAGEPWEEPDTRRAPRKAGLKPCCASAAAGPQDAGCKREGRGSADDSARPWALRAASGGHQGNPCLFPRQAFSLLATLEGDEGARQLFRSGALAGVPVEMPGGGADAGSPARDLFCDLDTLEAFERFARQAPRG